MTLSICHYHLQPGGVTRIIQSQIQALSGESCVDSVQIIAGFVPEKSLISHQLISVHPKLNYLPDSISKKQCLEYRNELLTFLKEKLAADMPHAREKFDHWIAELGGPDRTGKDVQ